MTLHVYKITYNDGDTYYEDGETIMIALSKLSYLESRIIEVQEIY